MVERAGKLYQSPGADVTKINTCCDELKNARHAPGLPVAPVCSEYELLDEVLHDSDADENESFVKGYN